MKDNKYTYALYTMLHPMRGFEEIKWYKKGSYESTALILLSLFILNVVQRQMTGFIFNRNNLEKINVISIFFIVIGAFVLWFISNLSLCSLMDGKGKAREVWISSCYALLPYIIVNYLVVLISNFVSAETGVFLVMAQNLATYWSIALMAIAMYTIHQFNITETVFNLILTVVGVCIITFLIVLVFSLFQQLFIFGYTIYNEIMFRL